MIAPIGKNLWIALVLLFCLPFSAKADLLSDTWVKVKGVVPPKAEVRKGISGQELFERMAKAYQNLGSAKKKKVSKVELQKIEKQLQEAIQFSGKNDSCGNKFCGPAETVKSCPQDCGTVPAVCGDGACQTPEITTCIRDCLVTGDFSPNDFTIWCQQQEGTSWHDLYCPHCGDGIINQPDEECDNGATNSNTTADACRMDCKNPRCGDGVVDPGRREQCEGSEWNCIASTCVRRPPPPPTCECDNPDDPKTCPTQPIPPNDPHYGTCSSPLTPWTKVFENPGHSDRNRGVSVDSNGTVWLLSAEGGEGSSYTHWLRQLDTCGNVVWERSIPSATDFFSNETTIDALDIDRCGNSYITGRSFASIFVKKYNFSGDLVWEDFFDVTPTFTARVTAVRDDGSELFVAGETDDSAIWIRKYTITGEVSTVRNYYPGGGITDVTAAELDEPGNLYLTGTTGVSPPSGGSGFSNRFWLTKFLAGDDAEWKFGARWETEWFSGKGISVSPDGTIHVSLSSTGSSSSGGLFPLVAHFTSDGTLITTYYSAYSPAWRVPSGIVAKQIGEEVKYFIGGGFLSISGSGIDSSTSNFMWTSKLNDLFSPEFDLLTALPPSVLRDGNGLYYVDIDVDPLGNIYATQIFPTSIESPIDSQWDIILRKYTPDGLSDGWPGP